MTTISNTTSSTRPSSPAIGASYFETDTGNFIIWNGSSWLLRYYDLVKPFNNYSLSFDGANDYVTTTLGSQVFAGDFTISTWIKATRSGTDTILFHLGSSSSYNDGFRIYQQGGGFSFWRGLNGYSQFLNTEAGTESVGNWQNLVVTRSGSNMTFYINGVSADTGSDASSYTNTTFKIGYPQYQLYQGLMDEVALWDSALSSSDVTAIYNSIGNDYLSTLSPVHWWRMGDNDGGTGTTITDQGSGGSNAALQNGPTFSTTTP